MKRHLSIIVLILMTIGITSCAQKRFVRIETTEMQRYDIVYDKSGKCGVYDNVADSLVTAMKYDAVRYAKSASDEGYNFTLWIFQQDEHYGLLSIEDSMNSIVEVIFPEKN